MATGPPVRSEPELDPPVEFGTIMDPVHGSIQLDKYLFKIIDRPEFQRLRKIKQFAGVYYVYPGGVHTRFEHSIGVCYIAGKLVDALNEHPRPTKTDKRLWITKEEKICIQIAALCHDIGHGSFSHLYDFAVEEKLSDDEKKNELSPHEYRSAEIIKNMMNSNLIKELRKFKGSVEAFTSDEEYFKLVKRIITFDKDCKKLPKAISKRKEEIRKLVDVFGEEKSYLFEIVANGFTGIDVDKMDYFARDARSVGLPNSFDWRVCYIASQLVDALNKNQQNIITPNEKKCIQIAALCHDLGHGPYSHLYDAAVKRHFKEEKSAHEHRSAQLIDDIMAVVDKDIIIPKDAVDKEGIWGKYIELVKDMITFSEFYKEYKKEEKKCEKGMKSEEKEDFEQRNLNNEKRFNDYWKKRTPDGTKSYKEKSYLFE
uniref:HD domain-containing protein n=1 Tax=Amphimedon queenslandica TaxID=400682 RepID=A0A1X7TTZ3_AMPQE